MFLNRQCIQALFVLRKVEGESGFKKEQQKKDCVVVVAQPTSSHRHYTLPAPCERVEMENRGGESLARQRVGGSNQN